MACCSQTPPESLPWAEANGLFYTRDLTRAQEEIPFTIVLPSYVPDLRTDPPPPIIVGPLKEYQDSDSVQIDIVYGVDLGNELLGAIYIIESSSPITPPDPAFNPQYEIIEIGGKSVTKWESPPESARYKIAFVFSHGNIYFSVEFDYFPSKDEAIKVIESMIN